MGKRSRRRMEVVDDDEYEDDEYEEEEERPSSRKKKKKKKKDRSELWGVAIAAGVSTVVAETYISAFKRYLKTSSRLTLPTNST